MFTTDFAESFSGLTSRQIQALEKKNILTPIRERGIKYYTYGDIYVLRLIKILKRAQIKQIPIQSALHFLRNLKPNQPLSSFVYLHDGKEIYAIIDTQHTNLNKYGQLILEGTVQFVAIGSELEATRQRMNTFVEDIKKSSKQLKAIN